MKYIFSFGLVLSMGIILSVQLQDIHKELNKDKFPYFMRGNQKWAENQLSKLSLEEKIAQFFMVASYPNRGEAHQNEIEQLVTNEKIGGIIYFQGTESQLKKSIQRMQSKAKTPLLIGMDAEWGVAMRVTDAERFPYAYTLGAANDTILSEKFGAILAQESRSLGVHMNFSPVADVNSNPKNPVIAYRALGENPELVSNHVRALVRGIEKNGVISSIKHFPGHGDTDKDSHYDLPLISHNLKHLNQIELKPFEAGIAAGSSSVMIGHLSVPALDESKTPATLSAVIIKDYLQKKLDFKGLVVSDALNMKAVSTKFGKVEVVVKAFKAGNDILLFPEDVKESIKAIVEKVKSGEISEDEINKRCLKVLQAKDFVLNSKVEKEYTAEEIAWTKQEVYEKAITVLKNEKSCLPLTDFSQKTAVVSIGSKVSPFQNMTAKFMKVDYYHYYTFEEAAERFKEKFDDYSTIITSIHPKSVGTANQFSCPGNSSLWVDKIPAETKHIAVICGNPMVLNAIQTEKIDGIIVAYENAKLAQETAAQLVFGAIGAEGKLAFHVSDSFKVGSGIKVEDSKRLKFSRPEELGIDSRDLQKIDAIVKKGLDAKAFPGCQVLVAVKGKVIYSKNFGTVSYEDSTAVSSEHIYDIASVSKIAGSTAALMRLQQLNKFSLNKQLKDYISEWVEGSEVGNILIKNMMAHQAGFTPWLAFYKKTLKDGELDTDIYHKQSSRTYDRPVASNLWIRSDYEKTIYKTIIETPLAQNPKYEYSDLGYYFAKKIIEKQSGFPLDEFMYKEFWSPMGLNNIRYTPLVYFPKEKIVPTENDIEFRKQLIHGFVHDPGAAMLGGVGGHAGIFSNATDLAAVMQLFLNKGFYGNRRYISDAIIEEFTSQQLTGNRRGAGFDRPTNSRQSGPTCELVSLSSYGHSGFTGTFTWADPEYGINYVFLSNRVNPNAGNKKIQEMNIRTDIQRVIYEAVLKSIKK